MLCDTFCACYTNLQEKGNQLELYEKHYFTQYKLITSSSSSQHIPFKQGKVILEKQNERICHRRRCMQSRDSFSKIICILTVPISKNFSTFLPLLTYELGISKAILRWQG